MNQEKLNNFMVEYEKALTEAVLKYNSEYRYPVSDVPNVVAKMKVAIENNTFSAAGRGFKGACKALGIKHTYKAISAYLER